MTLEAESGRRHDHVGDGGGVTMETIAYRVQRCIAWELGVDVEDVQTGCHLVEDLGADSLDMAGITLELEWGFGIVDHARRGRADRAHRPGLDRVHRAEDRSGGVTWRA